MRVEYILPFVIGLLVFVLVMMVGINVTSHRDMLQDQRKEDQARIEEILERLDRIEANQARIKEIQRRIDSKLDMLLTPPGPPPPTALCLSEEDMEILTIP